jgi:hypothetical protein
MEPGMTAWKWFECWKRTLVDERLSRLAMSPTVSNTKSRVKPANAYQCQPGDEEDGCDSSVVNLGRERGLIYPNESMETSSVRGSV